MQDTTIMLMCKFLDIDGHGGRTVIPFPLNTTNSVRSNPKYPNIDKLSIKDRVDQLEDLSSDERAMLLEHAASFYGIPPDQAAFSGADKRLATTANDLSHGFNISCEGGNMPFASGFADGVHGGQSLLILLCQPSISLDSDEEKLRLIETLHPRGLKLTSARAHLWSEDPFAGGVMPIRQAGFVGKYHEEVQTAHGRVYFCGSDFADGWRGFISGAFESSYCVTRDVLLRLEQES
ncbi:hypothetical protein ACJZ2D_016874 [Fusarium nematophilum]